MIRSDYHMHSDFSSDGKASMEAMIEKAIMLGLNRICFTDHMDYDYPAVGEYTFVFDIDKYLEKLNQLKEKYKSRIEILCGVELGLQTHVKDQIKTLTESYPFDFLIGSVHVVDHLDPYYPEYWEGKTEEEGIRRYFETIIENCKVIQNYHICGHIDYIIRYTPSMRAYKQSLINQESPKKYSGYSSLAYSDLLDEVLKTILYYGKGIEVNTSGLKYGLGQPHPSTDILKRYKELGGEIITIGSDAHQPEHIGYHFSYVEELLKSIGYRYYTVFKEGAPFMEKL